MSLSSSVVPVRNALTGYTRKALAQIRQRAENLGFTDPMHYIWPACQWGRFDPTKPIKSWDGAWRSLRKEAGLAGLRFHNLRHTIITELAEMGVPDHVMESITGHLSRRMLEHYSHIRLDAKRVALDALDAHRAEAAKRANSVGLEGATSQSAAQNAETETHSTH